jgi:hypothetical protein
MLNLRMLLAAAILYEADMHNLRDVRLCRAVQVFAQRQTSEVSPRRRPSQSNCLEPSADGAATPEM